MLKIENQNGDYIITLGVEFNALPAHLKGTVITKPFTFKFSASDLENLKSIEDKRKILQRAVDTMPPAKRDRIKEDSIVKEAFETTRFEHEFKESRDDTDKPDEPNEELRRKIILDDNYQVTEPAYLIMKNTAQSRVNALARAKEKMAKGEPFLTQEDVKLMHGDIYKGVNELRGFEHHLQTGYMRSGEYRSFNVGADELLAPHNKMVQQYMDDWDAFMLSPEAAEMHPVLLGLISHFMFVQIHPFQDGNGRSSREIYEVCLTCAQGGEFDTRGVMNISEGYNKAVMIAQVWPKTAVKPWNGLIEASSFIKEVGKMLEDSIDKAFVKIGISMPDLSRAA